MSVRSIIAAVLLGAAGCVVAQDFPSRPITMVVPFAAGGPTDTIARILSQSMMATLKQPVVVENTLGAGGTIAAARVAKSTPDGYTFLLHHNGMATSPALYRSLPFNPLTDYEYIGLVADVPMVLIAKKDLPPNNLKELLVYIGANKDKMSLGNAGLGAVSHQCGMLFLSAIQTQLATIPYKGTAPALNDLLGGQIDLLCDQTTQTTPYIRAGRVKVYGATT
jgi:tripartite-type tricarboxylate transporter receptor subunit TctC